MEFIPPEMRCEFALEYSRGHARLSYQEPVRTQDPDEHVARIQEVLAPFVRLSDDALREFNATTKDSPAMAEFLLRKYALLAEDPQYATKLDERYAITKIEIMLLALQAEVDQRRVGNSEDFRMFLGIPGEWLPPAAMPDPFMEYVD